MNFKEIPDFSIRKTDEEIKKASDLPNGSDLLQTFESNLRESVLSLEKEIYDLKYENNKVKGLSGRRKSLLEIEENVKLEKNHTMVKSIL